MPIVPGPAGIVAAIVVSVAVAIGSHYAIERPILALRMRWERRVAQANPQSESEGASESESERAPALVSR